MKCGDAICGGIISKTEFFKNMDANMMATYLPDKKYKEYRKLIKEFKEQEANIIVEKFGMQAV